MNFGADWMGIGAVDEKCARDLVDTALDAGVRLLDTADVYGRGASESLLGKIIRGRRSRFLIATKVAGEMRPGDPASGGLSARHIQEGLEASLKRLGTDHVDLYMPHAPDPRVPLEESLSAFERLRRQGKIRVLGCSNFPPALWRDCLRRAKSREGRFEFNQIQFSFAAPGAQAAQSPLCREEKTSVLAWSPLGGGLLSGKYMTKSGRGRRRAAGKSAFPALPEAALRSPLRLLEKVAAAEGLSMAQTAIGWLLGKRWVAGVVLGARTPAQLTETLAARPLSRRSMSILDRAVAVIGGTNR